MHFFQGRISDMPGIRADLFLAISKTGMCLLTFSFFKKSFTNLVPCWPRLEKKLILVRILKLDQISYGYE